MLASELEQIGGLEKSEEATSKIWGSRGQGPSSKVEGINKTIKSLQTAVKILIKEVKKLPVEE